VAHSNNIVLFLKFKFCIFVIYIVFYFYILILNFIIIMFQFLNIKRKKKTSLKKIEKISRLTNHILVIKKNNLSINGFIL